jgi:GNAT superfamily N-acetyltransferase
VGKKNLQSEEERKMNRSLSKKKMVEVPSEEADSDVVRIFSTGSIPDGPSDGVLAPGTSSGSHPAAASLHSSGGGGGGGGNENSLRDPFNSGEFGRVESSPMSSVMNKSFGMNGGSNPFGPPLDNSEVSRNQQFLAVNGSNLPPLMDLGAINSPDTSQLSINTPSVHSSPYPQVSPLENKNSESSGKSSGRKKNQHGSTPHHEPKESKDATHISFSKSETKMDEDKDSSGDVISSGSVGPPDRVTSDPHNRAPGGGWYRDDFNLRPYEETDNEDVKDLEKLCLRGGIEIGAFLRTRSVSDKSGLFSKTHLVVQIKSQGAGNAAANQSTRKMRGFSSKKGKAQVGDEICGFGCGAIERFMIDGTYNFMGYIVDLFVNPQYRRRNLASRIFQDLESRMRRVGVTMIIIRLPRTNDAGLHFIKKHGFSEMMDLRVIGWQCEVRILPFLSLVAHILKSESSPHNCRN